MDLIDVSIKVPVGWYYLIKDKKCTNRDSNYFSEEVPGTKTKELCKSCTHFGLYKSIFEREWNK